MGFFYIHDDISSSMKGDLSSGVRIFELDNDSVVWKEGEGPYATLQDLRQNSQIFSRLLKENPRRANRICEDKFIIRPIGFLIENPLFSEIIGSKDHRKLSHVFAGDIKSGKGVGAHLFNSNTMRIVKFTKTPDCNGVWEAEIEILNIQINKWIRKIEPSTFFPLHWTPDIFYHELTTALESIRAEITSQKPWHGRRKFLAKSISGLPISIILTNDSFVTAFPIYSG